MPPSTRGRDVKAIEHEAFGTAGEGQPVERFTQICGQVADYRFSTR